MSFCWTSCFQQLGHDELTNDIWKTGIDLLRLKTKLGVSEVTFFLDNTLRSECHGSKHDQSHTAQVLNYQLNLMSIFAIMIGNITFSPMQFDHNSAWSCDELIGVNSCQLWTITQGDKLTQFFQRSQTCKEGRLEAACQLGLLKRQIVNPKMAVGLFHHDVHLDTHGFSWCESGFIARYGVGLYKSEQNDIKRFGSRDDNHSFLNLNHNSGLKISNLSQCINTKCCSAQSPVGSPYSCSEAYGSRTLDLASFHIGTTTTTTTTTTSSIYTAGCEFTISAPGTINSPNYPSNYPLRYTCGWRITAGPGQVIKLDFTDFQVEYRTTNDCGPCTSCPYDYVTVHNGPATTDTTLGQYCGLHMPSPTFVTTTQNSMLVEFRSDSSYTYKGFSATITFI